MTVTNIIVFAKNFKLLAVKVIEFVVVIVVVVVVVVIVVCMLFNVINCFKTLES